MEEVVFRLEVPTGMKKQVGAAVEKVLSEFLDDVRYSVAREILEESELTEEQTRELGQRSKCRRSRKTPAAFIKQDIS
jgi:hypothetical protein